MNSKFENILIEVHALFTRNGIKSTTMDDAARSLGMSKKTLYKYVKDKPDLVSNVVRFQIELYTKAADSIVDQQVNAIEELIGIQSYFNNILSKMHPSFHFDMEKYYPEAWKLFLNFQNNFIFSCVSNNLEKGIKEGLYRKDLDVPIISRLYTAKIDLVFNPSIFPVEEFSFADVNVEMMKYHVKGIASTKGIKFLEKNKVSSILSKVKATAIAIALLFVLSPFFISGQTAYTLLEAQQFALKNSATVKNSALDVEIAKARIMEITASGLPQISGEASFNHFIDIPTQVAPAFDLGIPGIPSPDPDDLQEFKFGLPNSASAGITATQLIFDGTYIVGLQAAKAYRQLSETGTKKAKSDVKEAVANSYSMALMTNENVKIYKGSLDDIKASLHELVEMLKGGLIDEQEVDQMRLSVSSLSNTYDLAVTQQKVALELLKYQMGLKGNSEILLSDSLDVLMQSAENIELLSQKMNVSSHIDYQLIVSQENLYKLDVKKEKFRRLPSLAGFFTHSQNSYANELKFPQWYPTTIVGLSASIPIFSSGMTSSRIKQAKFNLEKIGNTRVSLIKGLEANYATSHSEYNNAIKNSRVAKRNRDLADKILKRTLIKQKEGLASSMDVTQVNTQYLNAQGQYINSIIGLLTAKIKLQKALNSY